MPTKNLRISVRKQSGFKHFGHALGKKFIITNQERRSAITIAIVLYELLLLL